MRLRWWAALLLGLAGLAALIYGLWLLPRWGLPLAAGASALWASHRLRAGASVSASLSVSPSLPAPAAPPAPAARDDAAEQPDPAAAGPGEYGAKASPPRRINVTFTVAQGPDMTWETFAAPGDDQRRVRVRQRPGT